jgi:aerobic carbon-monoxide dehydrogenase medium subunit
MENFNFHTPKTVAEAVSARKAAKEGKFLAGGQSLIPVLKLDLAQPTDLVSLAALRKDLTGISLDGDSVVIGALTTHADVAASELVQKHIPALSHLAAGIGDAQVRNRGTLGGSVAHADPAADYPAALVALEATIKTDRRSIPVDGFFKGMFETTLAPDELITEVRFKKPEKAGYAKFANSASKYALAGVFVAKHGASVRVAVTGASTVVFRLPAMEQALAKAFGPKSLDGIKVPETDLVSERDAGTDYRAHLVAVMAKRAVEYSLKHG